MVPTPSSARMDELKLAKPPSTMIIGAGPLAPLGRFTDAVKSLLLPPFSTCTEMELPLTDPVTVSGRPGFSP